MIVRKFTRDEWQMAFALAFMLHPSADVALQVVWDASWIATLLEQTEARRQRSVAHYKSPIPREALLQFAVFCASLRWERDQESPLPKMEPRYKPTRDDLVVRYVKHLVWNNLLKARIRYLAIALGCLLYDYKPKQITDFLGLYDEPKIRHIKSRIKKQLLKRFVYADVLTPKRNALRTKPASDHDRQLLKDALKLLTPWNTAHITVKPGELLLAKMFAENSKLTNWDRKHLLLDPVCGGLEQLIIEHNQLFRAGLRLADPKLKLFVPDFDDTPTPPVDRFKAPRLTDGEITLLNERRKRIGPRTYDVNDLLSDLYECGVDESLIEVLDDSASSTTESPPLRVLSQGSYAKGTRIRKQIVEEEDDAMGSMIVVVGCCGLGINYLSAVSEMWLEGSKPNFISLMEPDPYPDRYINCGPYTGDIRMYPINGQIAYESLPYLSWLAKDVVGSITGFDVFVEKYDLTCWNFIERSISDDLIRHGTTQYPFTNVWEWRHYRISGVPMVHDFFGWSWFDCPTVWDFIERSISEDLIRHGTIRYPFTNIWEWRHYLIPAHIGLNFFGWSWFDCPTVWDFMERSISEDLIRHGTIRYPFTNIWKWRHYLIPRVPPVQDFFGWNWFDGRKPEPSSSERSWIRLFCDDRERSNGYKVLNVCHGPTVSKHAELSPSPVYLKPNEPRGYSPSVNFEDSPFETQSPFRLTPPTDECLAMIMRHLVGDVPSKDLKPYVAEKELLVSDWYDGASARRLQDGYLSYSFRRRNATCMKKTYARANDAGPRLESSFPIWGTQMSANRASPETGTDAR
jgi:hypothetical protein